MIYVLLAGGGALGAVCRYSVGVAMMKLFPHPKIPVAMLVVNLLGSFGLGLFYGKMFGLVSLPAYDSMLFLSLGVGFFGAFTTFSTFSVESYHLWRDKKWMALLLYISISIIGSILAFFGGFLLFA
ncbi:fluoride efflux transporter CrcB [Alkalihalobacterium bogoriense]|uniref:fluoride efflux transporter CrcB n=1 Tax=Alkalihalobacterium bogoriense TaxID=246272 RepID=UPI00047E9C73|nr:fluoride efflux transporter CrcB [Alkalihalobacterium bogoriense]